jgi:hypothetical protein
MQNRKGHEGCAKDAMSFDVVFCISSRSLR